MRGDVNRDVDALLEEAAYRGACATSAERHLHRALDTRVRSGELVSPFPRLYVRREKWAALGPTERAVMLLRGAHDAHPSWVFCGASAAVLHGLSVSERLLDPIEVADPVRRPSRARGSVIIRYLTGEEPVLVGGMPATSVERTVFDCARWHGFVEGMVVADSALRQELATRNDLVCSAAARSGGFRGARTARLVAALADGRSANGGESIARATMYALGFAVPDLQVPIVDPVDARRMFYVDFLWTLPDGTMIIGELDGAEKYVNPLMNGGGALVALRSERRRESHLTIDRPRIMRFSPDEVVDLPRFERLLTAFGVPRDHEPLVVAAETSPLSEVVPVEAYGID